MPTTSKRLFGADWAPKANRKAAKEAGRVKGHTISLPENLREDWPQIMAILKELVGAPTTPKQTDRGLAISEKEALLLLKIAKSPLRQEIVDRIRNAQSGKANSDLGDALEAIIEEQELKAARKRLGLDDPGVGGEKPVLKRPVHGNIVLTGGRPVPRKEAVFTFEVTDDVDALRAPLIQIQWVVYPKDRPKFVFDAELNTYSPLRGQGPINDQLFEVTFPVAGNYVVEALVSHNFFLPAHFSTELKILTEEQEVNLQEKGPLSGFAAPKGAKTDKHDFDVGGFTSAVTDYEEGTVTRGKLDPAFKAGTLADRLKSIDAEIARVEKLCEQFRTPSNEHGAAVLHWAEDYLKELRSGRSAVEVSATDTQVVPCTGVYVSRSKKAPSKPLNLVCLQKRTADGYRVILHDLSQVYEAENYRFEVDNATAEGAYEEVFVEAAEAYPDGTLSIAFQGWSEKTQKPTDSYVKYRKVTDTVLKDVKTNVFDPAVNIAVNIAAAVMMVIPGLQAAGFALAIIWNTSQTLLELEEKAAKGTLKDKDLVYAGASFALDLLPVVGRSARVVSMGRKAYYAIELTQFAGQVLLVSLQGAEQIEKLRNGVISKLANLNERIVELERVNPSDPELDALRVQQDKLIREGQDAVIEVYGSIVAQQGLMMVGGALIQQAAIKKFGARLGELETQGRFAHREGESPHYDYDERRIVADRATMTQAEFESVERVARLAERLEGAVPDPSTRARVVESLGDGSVEIVVGGTKTHLESDAGRKVLHVADNAHADDILNAARGAPPRKPPHVTDPQTGGEGKPAPAGGDTDPGRRSEPPGGEAPKSGTTDVAPQFGLDRDQTRKLVDAVGPTQARELHEFFGDEPLRAIVKKTSASNLGEYAEGVRVARAAAVSDPRAAEGLARMRSRQHAGMGGEMAADTVADVLSRVPAGRMEIFLRALADPAGPHPRQLGHRLVDLASNLDELRFISEHGAALYKELRSEKAFRPLLEKLRGLDPYEAQLLVDSVRSARGPQGKLKAVGVDVPARRPHRATGKIAADKTDPAWKRHLERAEEFAKDHRGKVEDGVTPYNPTDEQIESLAVMYQIRENAAGNRKLSWDKRLQMLDEFDQLGRSAGLKTPWINNLRGGLSETLFAPNVGRNKTRLPHPDGGSTILDYAFESNERPGSKTGRKEWVEQKSDLITAAPGETGVSAPAVGRARRYVMDAKLDLESINAGAATRGDAILIEFVRPAGNEATERAMLGVLFGEGSPLQAVKFADGPWIERADFLAGSTGN